MRAFVWGALALLLTAGVVEAAQNTGGGAGGGASFLCGEPDNPGKCSCMGPIDSTDCKNMKKNCDGDISCGWLVDNCTCKYTPATLKKGFGNTIRQNNGSSNLKKSP